MKLRLKRCRNLACMNIILQRKKEVISLLEDVEKYPSTNPFKQEMMTFSYVLVCGAIEFMTESILHDWLNKTIKHHRSSSYRYRGKKYIQHFLDIQSQAREKNITEFHSTKLSEIKKLIGNIAGKSTKDKFSNLFDVSQISVATLQPDINARLDRITRIRHELAHGEKMPNDIQPNVTELKEDFIFVYEHIIKNIQKSLPRV